jgi:hypothetical protein
VTFSLGNRIYPDVLREICGCGCACHGPSVSFDACGCWGPECCANATKAVLKYAGAYGDHKCLAVYPPYSSALADRADSVQGVLATLARQLSTELTAAAGADSWGECFRCPTQGPLFAVPLGARFVLYMCEACAKEVAAERDGVHTTRQP